VDAQAKAELIAVAMEVRQHWLSQGLPLFPVSATQLEDLHRSFLEGLPEEYETFLRVAGLHQDGQEMVRFWKPHEIRRSSDVVREADEHNARVSRNKEQPPRNPHHERVFRTLDQSLVIADYMQESWWYALWISGPSRGLVSYVGGYTDGRDPAPVLGTLVEFLQAFMKDDERLGPPGGFDG
jgi:hypothetical protein